MRPSQQKIRYWQKIGVLSTERDKSNIRQQAEDLTRQLDFSYSFQVRQINEWRLRGISLQQIRKNISALNNLQINMKTTYAQSKSYGKKKSSAVITPSSAPPWFQMLNLDERSGPKLLAKSKGQLMDAIDGQYYFTFFPTEKHKTDKITSKNTVKQISNSQLFHQYGFANVSQQQQSEIVALEAELYNLDAYSQDKALSNQEQYKQHKIILHKMLQLLPNYVPAIIEIGNIAFYCAEYETAEQYYLQALEIIADSEHKQRSSLTTDDSNYDKEVRFNLGNVYCRQKKYAAAIRNYQLCLQRDPEFLDAYYNMALVFVQSGWTEQAIEAMQQFVQLSEDYQMVHTDDLKLAKNILNSLLAQKETKNTKV